MVISREEFRKMCKEVMSFADDPYVEGEDLLEAIESGPELLGEKINIKSDMEPLLRNVMAAFKSSMEAMHECMQTDYCKMKHIKELSEIFLEDMTPVECAGGPITAKEVNEWLKQRIKEKNKRR